MSYQFVAGNVPLYVGVRVWCREERSAFYVSLLVPRDFWVMSQSIPTVTILPLGQPRGKFS